MSSRAFVLLLFALFHIDFAYAACPTNWTILNRDCCSSTVGFNSTAPTFLVAQGVEFPQVVTVWNDSINWSLAIDTDWGTLNILWGEQSGSRSEPYAPHGLVDIVRIFHEPDKGLYGMQLHDSTGQY
jgi:hypothetical protein